MKMDKPVTKETKKRLVILVDSNVTVETLVDYQLQIMHAIDFLSRAVQDLANCGLPPDIYLLQEINTDCASINKSVCLHSMHTKAGSDDLRVILLPILKRNTITNSTQFSDWMQNVAQTLGKATYFDGFTTFIYMVREGNVKEDHTDLA